MAANKRSKRPEESDDAQSEGERRAMLHKGGLIQTKLEGLYPPASLAFHTHDDPFKLVVSVLLSAQTLGSMVRQVTPPLFAKASTPVAMVALGRAHIQEIIAPIGLSKSKAKYIEQLSQMLIDEYDGRVPESLEALERLPGVGHKTAGVVLLFGFGKPAFPVDTHIHRLACRWGCGDGKSVVKTEEQLKKWFPDREKWADLHMQLIRFGREKCPAMRHNIDTCPICSFAATNEARAANAAHTKKFVAAERHANPYAVREVVDKNRDDRATEDGEQEIDRIIERNDSGKKTLDGGDGETKQKQKGTHARAGATKKERKKSSHRDNSSGNEVTGGDGVDEGTKRGVKRTRVVEVSDDVEGWSGSDGTELQGKLVVGLRRSGRVRKRK